MIQVKVKNKIFEIPKVLRQDISMTKIDWLAKRFYETGDEEYINTLICIATRYIKKVASSFCRDVEDAKELSQELKIDLLRLLRRWKPKKGMYFNYLMKRQFYNFSCNFIKNLKRIPIIDVEQVQEFLLFEKSDFVKDFEAKDLVEKLLLCVDDKMKEILELMLCGITNCEQIGEALSISGMAVRNRIKKCKPLLLKLLEEKNVQSCQRG